MALVEEGFDINHDRYPEGYQEAPLAYDAVWSVALAFNKTMERLRERKKSLKDFTYTDKDIADEIYAAMNSTQFLGVSVSMNTKILLFLLLLQLSCIVLSLQFKFLYKPRLPLQNQKDDVNLNELHCQCCLCWVQNCIASATTGNNKMLVGHNIGFYSFSCCVISYLLLWPILTTLKCTSVENLICCFLLLPKKIP